MANRLLPASATRALSRYASLVDDEEAFLAACARPLPLCGWMSPLRSAAPDSWDAMASDGIRYRTLSWRPAGIRLDTVPSMAESVAYRAGLFHIQEEASLLPVAMLAPQPGERILDLCAAPGNKTAEIASTMGGRGTVVANDRAASRLGVLQTTLDRLGLLNVSATALDGRSPAWPSDHFDAVLVDAPCSCDATVRKSPRAAAATSEAERQKIATMQLDLLLNALRMVRPGGRVVYATCSFAPEENELVVASALAQTPGIRVQPVSLSGLDHGPGITHWNGASLPDSLAHAVRLWPHLSDSGGFFAVLLVKEGPAVANREAHEAVPPIENPQVTSIMSFFEELYGLSHGWDDSLRGFIRASKGLDVIRNDHAPDLSINVFAHGLCLARVNGRVPKLTTQGSLFLGSRITRQFVTLDRPQTVRFMQGESVEPTATEAVFGYVQVRCHDLPVGVGLYDPSRGMLESQYPGSWGGLGRPRNSEGVVI
ncbi:MAG: 16S rRNA C967 or C1407 C5-methylase (RsmB/RsmF family)/NOL1/NOP2 [Rhodothermales bacterium]|jgi:16S rRNA C967 or C1407 C5-methylase (RsmB/RsmF family)/NOL1/NOP2/fmu family ribosome biogenesis protein